MIFFYLIVAFFIHQVRSANVVPSLSLLSIRMIILDIAFGKIHLQNIRGFYIKDLRWGIESLSAFLAKHFLNYNSEEFKAELEAIHECGIASCILQKEHPDETAGPRILFDELKNLGLYQALILSKSPFIE